MMRAKEGGALGHRLVATCALGVSTLGVLLVGTGPAHAATATKARSLIGPTITTPYGPVQVRVRVRGHRLLDVRVLQAPTGDPRSRAITAYAIPALRRQALAAASSRIDGVSGASYTSQAFARSLQGALSRVAR